MIPSAPVPSPALRSGSDVPATLMRARVALRERALLDVLDLSVRFSASHARAYAKLSLVVLLPAFAASWGAGSLGGAALAWTAAYVIGAFAGAPFVALASRLVFADRVGTGEALKVALRSMPGLVAARALQGIALGASALGLGLPWIWLGTILLFVVEALVLEQASVGQAISRAQRIANANFGPAFMMLLVAVAAPLGAALIADVAGRDVLQTIFEVRPPASLLREGWSALALLGWWAAMPLVCTARFFVYLDTRTRTEGWDIQTRFAGIAARLDAQTAERAERARFAGGRAA